MKIKHKDRITILRGNHENKYQPFNLDKLIETMDSMINASRSIQIRIYGNYSHKYSNIYL